MNSSHQKPHLLLISPALFTIFCLILYKAKYVWMNGTAPMFVKKACVHGIVYMLQKRNRKKFQLALPYKVKSNIYALI